MQNRSVVTTVIALFLNGCTSFCSGAGCDEGFSSTIAVIHLGGSNNDEAIINPVDGYNSFTGLESDGNGWSAALPIGPYSGDGLLFGIPNESRVVMIEHNRTEDSTGTSTLQESVTRTLQSSVAGSDFGAAVTYVPDMNGDGIPEFAVGAPSETGGGTNSEAGAAYLSTGPLFSDNAEQSSEIPKVRVISEEAYDHLGEALAGCDDVDGDGLGDLLIASPRATLEGRLAGEVGLLSSQQLATTAAEIQAGSLSVTWTGSNEGDSLGVSMSCDSGTIVLGAPYANSDGALNSGAVYLLRSTELTSGPIGEIAWVTLVGQTEEQYFGSSLATGDIDGDGQLEIAVGSPGYDNGRGLVSVFSIAEIEQGSTDPVWEIEGAVTGDRFGSHIEIADRDGDSKEDLWVGAPRANPSGLNLSFYSGVLYLFHGSTELGDSGLYRSYSDDADVTWHEAVGYRKLGSNFVVGEISGDEMADLVVLLGTP